MKGAVRRYNLTTPGAGLRQESRPQEGSGELRLREDFRSRGGFTEVWGLGTGWNRAFFDNLSISRVP
jgi:hypothetical protein